MNISNDKDRLKKSKTKIHLGKTIIVLLLVLSQLFICIEKVEAYPYDAGYDYLYFHGLMDSGKRTHYFRTAFVNGYGYELHYSIINSDGTNYQDSARIMSLDFNGAYYRGTGIAAVVPTSDDLSTIDIYIEINYGSWGGSTGGLGVVSMTWNGIKYSKASTMKILIEPQWASHESGSLADTYITITNNGVVYRKCRMNVGYNKYENMFEMLGTISKSGFKSTRFRNNNWYDYSDFSTNLSYAYGPYWEEGKYIRVNRYGVEEILEGDYHPILYKILDLEHYKDHGKDTPWAISYYNDIYNIGGTARTIYYNYSAKISYIAKNTAPDLTLDNPLSNSVYVKEEGLSTITVSGTVRDLDNDTLTVAVTLGGVTKSTTITNTLSSKNYNFTFDVFEDEITDGTHKIEVSVTDGKIRTPITLARNITVKGRVRHNGFVLVGSPLYYKLIYQDEESDPKHQEQFRYVHDPNYFKNSLGVIPDSNTWKNTVYNNLSLPGHYKVTSKAKDNPKNISTFDEFKMWSRESLSEINLYVHRKPIAVFKASINNLGNLTITDVDKSYDLDHQGETNNGIIARQWRWRKIEDVTWTTSSNPPTSFTPGQEYILGLRVRDKDGENGIGVWGDWTDLNIGTGTMAPLKASFTLNPSIVSHNPSKTITVANLSSGAITRYEWIIRKAGVQQGSIISTAVPTSAQLKAYGIGQYTLQLRVGDASRWSEPYTLPYEVINNPPIAKFEAPEVVYRDTNISLINKTAADLDGDTITYLWKLKQPSGAEYNISTAHSPTFKIQSFLNSYAINPVTAISKNWEIKLIATDAKGAKSEFTKDLEVINNVPEAKINGPTSAKQYTTHSYTSSDTDADTGDNPLTIFRWKHIRPDGSYNAYTTKDIQITFNEHGTHAIEHYTIDRIGDKSKTASLSIDVEENLAPSMVITSPNGTITKPKVIPGDPMMEWTYTDPESDPQEKYSFDFYYADDDILVKSLTNSDATGNIRKHQMPDNTFERFRTVKGVGRVYSKYKWSELSNIIYFIINDAPIPGFTLDKKTVIRGEEINVISTAYDPNEEQGDSITYKYYLQKLPDGAETFYTNLKDFTLSISTLTANRASDQYRIRQVVTDTLGVSSEHKETITVVNQKPTVEVIQPSSGDINNPTTFIQKQPEFKWDYLDGDNDTQKQFRIFIYDGNTNNIVISSGNIVSNNKNWIVSTELEEHKLYSVAIQVYDGHEWSELSHRKYFKYIPFFIEDISDVKGRRGDKVKVTITTSIGANEVQVTLPSLFQRTIQLNEKPYIFGNPNPKAKLIKTTEEKMTWEYEFIIPWTQTSPPDDIYSIPVKATFTGGTSLENNFNCIVEGYIQYYNPGGTYR